MNGPLIGLIRFIVGIALMLFGAWDITQGHWAPGLALAGIGVLIFGLPGTGEAGGSGWKVRGPIGFVMIVIGAAMYALNIGR